MRIDFSKAHHLGEPTHAQVVYVYSIDGITDRVKIGHTTQADYRQRIRQQLEASTPGTVIVNIVYHTTDSAALEQALHRQLKDKQVTGGREWFLPHLAGC